LEAKTKSRVLQEFQEASKTLLNPALKKEKEKGTKVIGYFCSYGPAEVITAAGMIPFRMRATGSTGTDLSDAYLSSINCSFCRHAFNMGLAGNFDFLDGLIVLNNCDHVRRIYDNWRRKVKTPFIHMMGLPKMTTATQVQWFYDELVNLKDALEKQMGVKITDNKLREAIKIHNETRQLLKQLYALRKKDTPPLTGAETLSVVVASTCMPQAEYNQMLKELIKDLKSAEGIKDYKARMMLVGSILDDPNYVKVIEDMGGLVVTDSLCFGTRMFWTAVDEKEKDPLRALAKHYIQDKPACPRMFDKQVARSKYIQDMVKEFKVVGVIGLRMVMCDIWTGELFMLDKDLKAAKIPLIRLDREYAVVGAGQLRTRAQAFIESIGGRR